MGKLIYEPSLELPHTRQALSSGLCLLGCLQPALSAAPRGSEWPYFTFTSRQWDFMNSACQVVLSYISIVKCTCASGMREIGFSSRTEPKILYFHIFESKSKTLIFFTSKNISRDNREFISNDIESKTSSHFPPWSSQKIKKKVYSFFNNQIALQD